MQGGLYIDDGDMIAVERTGPGEAEAFVHHGPGPGETFGVIHHLEAAELVAGAGFDFGPSLSPGCANLAYSILRACLPADAARQWRAWFCQGVVAGGHEPRWTITAGDVRAIIAQAERWFERSTPARRERAAGWKENGKRKKQKTDGEEDGPASWAEELVAATRTF